MITTDQYLPMLFTACPSFKVYYDNLDDWVKEFNYMLAGDLGNHLHECHKSNKTEEFADLAAVIEEFIIYGDADMKNLAIIGILEGIQNVWIDEDLDPEIITKYLLPKSLQYWHSLNSFWNAEIPVVGYDVDNTSGSDKGKLRQLIANALKVIFPKSK